MGGRHCAGRRHSHPGLGSNAHYGLCGRTAGAVAGQADVTCPNDVDEGALFSARGFFDYYGVSRGENSDGPRNHTRIGAAIECERSHTRTGVKAMEALLKRKAFDIPKPGTPEVEPEDIEAPDITRPISQDTSRGLLARLSAGWR